ncbi:hypothetical protein V2J09_014009 [Rumex salicifolius]
MAWLPVSSQWRNLRKISALQLFTKHSLDVTQILREKKVVELLKEGSSSLSAKDDVLGALLKINKENDSADFH